jgi:hypothetical protein
VGKSVAESPPKYNWKERFTMKPEGSPSPAEKGSQNGHKPNLKERAVHQLREFLAMFIYLWVLLTLFVINQSAVLAREHHNYQAHFFAFVNALILAKVLLIGEDLHLGNRFRDKPLLYSIFYKCFVFTIFFIGVHILERVIVGVWSGRTIGQSFLDIGRGSLNGILSLGATVFVALIPFFAFREISRVIGPGELWSLLLSRGTRVYTLQSRPQQ